MLDRLQKAFKSLEENEVRYIVIGGIAAILHGVPRMTFDLDIVIDPTPENAERLLKALLEAGFGTADLITPIQLLKNDITVFSDFERIDVMIRPPGIEFQTAWKNRELKDVEYAVLPVLCRADLIASKKASGRPIDLEDVRLLELAASD